MSAFPNVLFGPDNEIYNTYTDKRWALGTQLILSDGRKFRFGLEGAVAAVPGKVYQARVPIAAHILQTPTTAGVVGDSSLTLTIGATAIAANDYLDGYLSVELGTGMGYTYALGAHGAYLASATTVAIPFKRGVTLQAAVPTTANSVSLISNAYFKALLAPVTTRTMPVIGVPVAAIAIGSYGWFQTHGPAATFCTGTVVVGDAVISPSAAAGMCQAQNSTLTVKEFVVGTVMDVASSTNASTLNLLIEG